MVESSTTRTRSFRRDYSREDMSWAVSLANRGYDEEGIYLALSAMPSGRRDPGSVKYQRLLSAKGKKAADAYARRTARNAIQFVHDNPMILDRTAALADLWAVRQTIERVPWGIYAGPGPRRTLEGALRVAEGLGSASWYGLALRQWSELVGQSFRAVRSNRDVLTDLGWIRRHPKDRPHRTARYKLRTPTHIQPAHSLTPVGEECAGSRGAAHWVYTDSAPSQLAHDAYRPDALGDPAWYLHHTLLVVPRPQPLEVVELRTGYIADDLLDLVATLERYDLLHRDDDALAVPDDLLDRLDRVAVDLGTAGAADADRATYRQEQTARREAHEEAQGRNVQDSDEEGSS